MLLVEQQALFRGRIIEKLVIVNMELTELDYLADLVVHERKIGEVLAEANKMICTNE
ncbi:hypothetical protein DFP93_105140 [Aneurinibacillus soli]|uniref:Uncharacterized protein n=1 Tax=Aneurinibacillus soli TaxID=1500254 RepID=A0A0U5B213_9BACL|nr:hypothetical protein DFP93_105140 [Aneurinibacillus soli]BAU28626.1 hypothetical protein CB4_02801 [Aneurinibacillus soli]